MRRAIVIALCVTAWGLASAPARAQTEEEIAEARLSFERGESLFGEENYALALEAFEHSYSLLEGFPRQHLVLFNVARCQEELGRLADAVETFERYLAEGGADQGNADETRRRITELGRRLEMAGDGGAAGSDTSGDDGMLIAGIVLEAVGGAAGIASLATGLVAHDIYQDLESRCVPVDACPTGSNADISTGSALAWSSTILLPVSIAALGAGTVLLILAMTGDSNETAELEVVPLPGGASVRGRF